MLSYLRNSSKTLLAHFNYYPTPYNFTYFWNFGFIASVFLFIQIFSGIFLAMHYIPSVDLAFLSIESIMRDLNFGWFLRYTHSNGASCFFIVVYLHIARGLYYKVYSSDNLFLWISGILIFLFMIITAFIGYVLPWGQMSFWAATVITNLLSIIPKIGSAVVYWIWGGFSVSAPTLTRFFSLHYLLPFLLVLLVFIHLILLHEKGSTNPYFLSSNINRGYAFLYPYFIIKDVLGLFVFFFLFLFFVSYAPNYLGHTDNYIPANALVTPAHIIPEWYFLPFYAILRAIPEKSLGVIFMLLSILIFLFLPFFSKKSEVYAFCDQIYFRIFSTYVIYPFFLSFFYVAFILLGWLGSQAAEAPFLILGLLLLTVYFVLLMVLPLLSNLVSLLLLFLNKNLVNTKLNKASSYNFLIYIFSDYNEGHSFSYFNQVVVNYYNSYYIFFIFMLLCFSLSFILVFASYFSSTYPILLDNAKLKAYECGFDPIYSTRDSVFTIHFFRVALIFLVFDLELIYLVPWVFVGFKSAFFTFIYFYIFCVFLFFLILGVLYEYFMNSLDWFS